MKHLNWNELEFFPDGAQRNMENFLKMFTVVCPVVYKLRKRVDHQKHFNKFWNRCLEYLRKCDEPELANVLQDDNSQFRQITLNYWRNTYSGDPDKLDHMYNCFRSCFGIYGNEEVCRIYDPNEPIFDWKRIEKCHKDFYREVETV